MKQKWKFDIFNPLGEKCYTSSYSYDSKMEARFVAIKLIGVKYNSAHQFETFPVS